MSKESSIKILVAYHEPADIIKNEIMVPIHVGRAILKNRKDQESMNKMEEMRKFSIGDDTGDNISLKNLSYNEMTAVYWAWKNYEDLGDPDHIGLMHYRRLLYNTDKEGAFFERNSICNNDIDEVLKLSKDELLKTFEEYDFVSSTPYYRKTVYEHFKENHDINDLDIAIEILKEKYPDYSESCDKYLQGNNAYFCNMFIFPKNIFMAYCSWIFDILFEFENRVDITDKRLFISERLTGIYIQHLIDNKKKCKNMPTMYIESGLKIPVVYASDINYMVPTCTSIVSLLENKGPVTNYIIHILAPLDDLDSSREMVKPLIDKYGAEVVIHPISEFKDVHIQISHITSPTYFRLALPSLLPEVSKCIYLDSDTVVEEDLSTLFRHNISDFYIAGVKAAGYHYPKDHAERHREKIKIESMDRYVNAGVLVFNLKKIREDGIDKKFMLMSKKKYPSQDQDIINIACFDAIRHLPLKFNSMTKYLRVTSGKIVVDDIGKAVYDKDELNEAIQKPTVIHFADKIKPWDSTTAVLADRWRHYNDIYFDISGRSRSKVSVIVPVYNKEEYIRQCLNSVLSQTLSDIEVICIDDGSTDGSAAILSEYAAKDNRIVVLSQNNLGVSHARNRGIANAKGEFIAFMDPDDYYPSVDVLEVLHYLVVANGVKVAGGSWSEDIDGEVKTVFEGRNSKYTFNKDGVIKYFDYQFDYGFHRFIYSREMLISSNVVFPSYIRFQDTLFFIKAMIAADKFYATTKQTYRYRWGHQNLNWDDVRCRDTLLGLIDNLRISSRNKLADLHETTLNRINDIYGPEILNHIRSGTYDPYLIELLIRANTALDRNLLRNSKLKIGENYYIKPLKEVIKHYYGISNGSIVGEKSILGRIFSKVKSTFGDRS
jgi:lipopolysaccharide biosynthesis glycosyltransferase/uncharacterized protein YbjQ (UPF0145 family)